MEDFDSCLIQVLSELCKQFKNVTDYIRTHREDRLGFMDNVSLSTLGEGEALDEEDEVARMLTTHDKL